ncbi:MAG: hypothetical protein AAGH89_19185 [Verrucomicrobiota bacterium]
MKVYLTTTLLCFVIWIGLIVLSNLRPFCGTFYHDNGDQIDIFVQFGEIKMSPFLLSYPKASWNPSNVTFQPGPAESSPSLQQFVEEWRYHTGLDFFPNYPSKEAPKEWNIPVWAPIFVGWLVAISGLYLSSQGMSNKALRTLVQETERKKFATL